MPATAAIAALWVPCAVFAHLFAAFWLFKAFLVAKPHAAQALRAWAWRLPRLWRRPPRTAARGRATPAPGALQLTVNGADDDGPQRLEKKRSIVAAPLSLEWQGLGCTYATAQAAGGRTVLQGVSGCAHPGQMMALVGPSGAGKSTLLDILALRQGGSGQVSGRVLVNGQPRKKSAFRYA